MSAASVSQSTKASSLAAARPSIHASRPAAPEQQYLDLQPHAAKHHTCATCGMLWTVGLPEDEAVHGATCAAAAAPWMIPTWRRMTDCHVVQPGRMRATAGESLAERLAEVASDSEEEPGSGGAAAAAAAPKQAQPVAIVTPRPDTATAKTAWRVLHRELGLRMPLGLTVSPQITQLPGHVKTSLHLRIAVDVRTGQVMGIAVGHALPVSTCLWPLSIEVQAAMEAHEAAGPRSASLTPSPPPRPSVAKHQPLVLAAETALSAGDISAGAWMGVLGVWVHAQHRQRGIAAVLLDCLRSAVHPAVVVSRACVAFTEPTHAGQQLAAKYTGDAALVYAVSGLPEPSRPASTGKTA